MSIFSVDSRIMFSKDLFLRKPCRKLEREEVLSDDFKQIVHFMLTSLYENPIGVGLAAPQIGLQICLVVIDIKRNGKKPLVLINPEFRPIENDLIDSRESCLSFSEYDGTVKRYKKIRVTAKDMKFENIEFETDTFLSMVCQHEIDHLNGNVYIDKSETLNISDNRYENLATIAIQNLSSN